MREWFKKNLGLLGFGVWMFGTLFFVIAEFILRISLDSSILMMGFVIMGATTTIHDILNEKYFTKYSEKVKNGIIVFITSTTIGMFFILAYLLI